METLRLGSVLRVSCSRFLTSPVQRVHFCQRLPEVYNPPASWVPNPRQTKNADTLPSPRNRDGGDSRGQYVYCISIVDDDINMRRIVPNHQSQMLIAKLHSMCYLNTIFTLPASSR
jgi:hypothetical protein